jgi:hypothetical protein
MVLMPSISYETLMNFDWQETKSWHKIAVETRNALRGIK